MRKIIITITLLVVIILIGSILYSRSTPTDWLSPNRLPLKEENNTSLSISAHLTMPNGQEIGVRVADTPKTRELGLSYFKSLPESEGMLFLFDKSGAYPFWMKGMNFPLDIIWLKREEDGGFRVVYLEKNVLPSSYPNTINPKVLSDAILEINSNLSTVYNLDLEKKLFFCMLVCRRCIMEFVSLFKTILNL
jgi:uncharacterized membrane protein (UPF0127 family)